MLYLVRLKVDYNYIDYKEVDLWVDLLDASLIREC